MFLQRAPEITMRWKAVLTARRHDDESTLGDDLRGGRNAFDCLIEVRIERCSAVGRHHDRIRLAACDHGGLSGKRTGEPFAGREQRTQVCRPDGPADSVDEARGFVSEAVHTSRLDDVDPCVGHIDIDASEAVFKRDGHEV